MACTSTACIISHCPLPYTHAENGVHFYYVPGRVLGFADGSDAVRLTADVDDEVGEHRLCWSLVPGRGGWRAGEDRNLGQSREYEKVIMVWQQP